jgi:hypothetical protein
MNRSIIFKVVMALVLVAALVGIGYYAFNLGVAQGMAVKLPAASADGGAAPLTYPYFGMRHYYPFFGFGGLGCFGLLIPLFLLFLVFAAFRGIFWHYGPRRWHMMGHGPWGRGPWGHGPTDMPPSGENGMNVPPMVSEWHRRMHEQAEQKETKADQSPD